MNVSVSVCVCGVFLGLVGPALYTVTCFPSVGTSVQQPEEFLWKHPVIPWNYLLIHTCHLFQVAGEERVFIAGLRL